LQGATVAAVRRSLGLMSSLVH